MRTVIGVEANVPIPRQQSWEEELESAAERIGKEMEKAFTIAGRELEHAVRRIKNEVQKTPTKEFVKCANCDEHNQQGTNFCFKCGTKLQE
jgi:DNA topoisomerase VI subunit B